MLKEQRVFRAFATPIIAAFAVTLVGCATVKRDEFNAEIAAVRGVNTAAPLVRRSRRRATHPTLKPS